MKQLEVKKTITYRWWRTGNRLVQARRVVELKEAAQARISELLPQGFTEGQLVHTTRGCVDYLGYWEVA